MDLVEGLHHRLILSLSSSESADSTPLTIGDLYQRFIPYRTVRDELHILELAEYEHALLRLLAGEGYRLEVEPDSVRLEFRRELASSNPILGIYRDYSEASVRVRQNSEMEPFPFQEEPAASADASGPRVGLAATKIAEAGAQPIGQPSRQPTRVGPAGRSEHRAESEASEAELEINDGPDGEFDSLPLIYPPAEDTTGSSSRSQRAPVRPADSTPHLPPGTTDISELTHYCGSCSAQLPSTLDVRFCPFCGTTQVLRPCGRCGSRCESHWSFCAGCGFSLS